MLKQRCQQPANRSSLLDEDAENSVLRLREARAMQGVSHLLVLKESRRHYLYMDKFFETF